MSIGMKRVVVNGLWKSDRGLLVRLKGEAKVGVRTYQGFFLVAAEIVVGSAPEEGDTMLKPVMPNRDFWLRVPYAYNLEEKWFVECFRPYGNAADVVGAILLEKHTGVALSGVK